MRIRIFFRSPFVISNVEWFHYWSTCSVRNIFGHPFTRRVAVPSFVPVSGSLLYARCDYCPTACTNFETDNTKPDDFLLEMTTKRLSISRSNESQALRLHHRRRLIYVTVYGETGKLYHRYTITFVHWINDFLFFFLWFSLNQFGCVECKNTLYARWRFSSVRKSIK